MITLLIMGAMSIKQGATKLMSSWNLRDDFSEYYSQECKNLGSQKRFAA
jgi:hypothetical protein